MIKVTVLLFAYYRDLAGSGELQVELPEGATAATLVAAVRKRGGGLARLPSSPVVAVNQDYSRLETVLADGDEVALLPPVSGG